MGNNNKKSKHFIFCFIREKNIITDARETRGVGLPMIQSEQDSDTFLRCYSIKHYIFKTCWIDVRTRVPTSNRHGIEVSGMDRVVNMDLVCYRL